MVNVEEGFRRSVSPEIENIVTSFHNNLTRKKEQLRSLEQIQRRLAGEKEAVDELKAFNRNSYNVEFQRQDAYIERLSGRLEDLNRQLENLTEIHNNLLAEIQ